MTDNIFKNYRKIYESSKNFFDGLPEEFEQKYIKDVKEMKEFYDSLSDDDKLLCDFFEALSRDPSQYINIYDRNK